MNVNIILIFALSRAVMKKAQLLRAQVLLARNVSVAGSTARRSVPARLLAFLCFGIRFVRVRAANDQAHPTLCLRCADVVQEIGVESSGRWSHVRFTSFGKEGQKGEPQDYTN